MSVPLLLAASRAASTAAPRFCLRSGDLSAKDIFGWRHLEGDPDAVRGRSVLVATQSQAAAALALLALDGVARRLVVATPGLGTADLQAVAAHAEIEAVVCEPASWQPVFSAWPSLAVDFDNRAEPLEGKQECETEWVLLTSGTTGSPKLVVHTLRTLTDAIVRGAKSGPRVRGTFYDIRRYGGLQIFLRAMVGGDALVLPDVSETVEDFLERAAETGLDFCSGTPSHWRRALMGRGPARLALSSVRLSGEIADQAVLDRLRDRFRSADLVHAFASTEAGLAFEVADGREGFPAALLDSTGTPVALRIEDNTLRIRSPRTALRLLGSDEPVADAQGFVDTRDVIERRGDRCHFAGRRDGVINSGGNKVHPEEIEALLNAHPLVEMSRAKARKNSVLGALIEADVVLRHRARAAPHDIERELLGFCAARLPRHKRPSAIHLVPKLEIGAAGKLERARG